MVEKPIVKTEPGSLRGATLSSMAVIVVIVIIISERKFSHSLALSLLPVKNIHVIWRDVQAQLGKTKSASF